jgi:hypothetical protein
MMEDKENKELNMGELLVVEKIPFTQRLQDSAASLFGQVFAGVVMICVAPFTALRILFDSERKVMDLSKLPVDLLGGMDMGPPPASYGAIPMNMGDGELPKEITDLFDAREPWKKDHDEMYGDDGEPKN